MAGGVNGRVGEYGPSVELPRSPLSLSGGGAEGEGSYASGSVALTVGEGCRRRRRGE